MVVDNVEKLRPVIEGTLKHTYGETVQNIEILRANKIPIIDQKKESWRVEVVFDDSKTEYEVSIDIRISDGSVKRTEEIVRKPLTK